ncbi:hypothetical protein VIC_004449 [Vibrio coralliilyticus ATCC BAA-450]|nr:hypothetical protein VIC_004449 [Vibrio coralliilyticus ATCC BAA-450]
MLNNAAELAAPKHFAQPINNISALLGKVYANLLIFANFFIN